MSFYHFENIGDMDRHVYQNSVVWIVGKGWVLGDQELINPLDLLAPGGSMVIFRGGRPYSSKTWKVCLDLTKTLRVTIFWPTFREYYAFNIYIHSNMYTKHFK